MSGERKKARKQAREGDGNSVRERERQTEKERKQAREGNRKNVRVCERERMRKKRNCMHRLKKLWNTHQALGFSKLLFVPSALAPPEFAQNSFELRCNTLQHTATHNNAPHHTPEFNTHILQSLTI